MYRPSSGEKKHISYIRDGRVFLEEGMMGRMYQSEEGSVAKRAVSQN